jgi:hypothetical protein
MDHDNAHADAGPAGFPITERVPAGVSRAVSALLRLTAA